MPMRPVESALRSERPLLCAEGYIFELQRRGYCKAGPYVPEVLLDRPDVVRSVHEEFAHAGSDVLVACQYYANYNKLEQVNLGHMFEKINRQALQVCRQEALESDCFSAGNLCNSVDYNPLDGAAIQSVRNMFREQILWATEEGVDIFVCETFREYGEASLALHTVQEYAPGVPCLVSLAPYDSQTKDGLKFADALTLLYNEGAAVVGLNCARGPDTMIDLLREIRRDYKGPLSGTPIPYRTTRAQPTWAELEHPVTGECAFPDDLDAVACGCSEIASFGKRAKDLGLSWTGLCCGNSARYTRALADSIGKESKSDRYKTDISGSVWEGDRKASMQRQKIAKYELEANERINIGG